MPETMSGRKVLVSGGASGIGRATAMKLAEAGCRVQIADRDAPANDLPAGVGFQRTDVTDAADIDALFAAMQAGDGLPDALISCAGIGIHERLDEGDPAKWAQVFEVNVMGALRLIRAFAPEMIRRGGDVVIVSSVAAHQAYPWGGAYAASKAALEMIAETLRLEGLPKLRVLTLAPGVVDTAFFDHMISGNQSVNNIGFGSVDPDQVAELILFALSRPENMAVNQLVVRPRGQPF